MKQDMSHSIELKSPREIGLMRQSGIAVWQAHQIAAKWSRPA